MSRRSWLFFSALITLTILVDISQAYALLFGSDLALRPISVDAHGSAGFEIIKTPVYVYVVLFVMNVGSIFGFIQHKKSN